MPECRTRDIGLFNSMAHRAGVNSKRNLNYSIPFNSIPELELKDFEQKELEFERFCVKGIGIERK